MAELEWEGEPERASLRRAIRHRLRRFDPALRVVAEDFLAETTPIDLLAIGAEGEVVSIRIADVGDDAAALTRSLADLSWLRPRLADLLKLAPGLGLEPSAEPRAMLFCPEFEHETRSAADNLPEHSLHLLGYRCFRLQGRLGVLFETWKPSGAARPEPAARQSPPSGPRAHAHGQSHDPTRGPSGPRRPGRLTDPPSPSTFRTGLTDADLGFTSGPSLLVDPTVR